MLLVYSKHMIKMLFDTTHINRSVISLFTQNCDLTGCDLQHTNLRGSNLAGAILEDITAPLHMSQTVNVTTVHASNLPIQLQGGGVGGGAVIVNPAALQNGGNPPHQGHPPQAQLGHRQDIRTHNDTAQPVQAPIQQGSNPG